MATAFLSTAITSLPSRLSSSPSSSSPSSSSSSSSSYSSLTKPALDYPHRDNNTRKLLTICKSVSDPSPPTPILTKRALSLCSITSLFFSLAGKGYSIANAAILEADDDVELMEKVKQDRKKRLERQGVVNSSKEEKGYLQELVYKLSKIGQAIDNNDLSAASSVLGGSTNSDWVKKANKAFTKLSSSPEEKSQVDTFNSSLASLISSVTRNDVESSKIAFVSSASAFEQWTTLTGLIEQLKGL